MKVGDVGMGYVILLVVAVVVWSKFSVSLSKMWLAFCAPLFDRVSRGARGVVAGSPERSSARSAGVVDAVDSKDAK
jgi:hypothetical protein